MVRFFGAFVAALLAIAGITTTAIAQNTLDINYYTISASDPDANHLAFGTFNNEVQNTLGPDGLPVLNTAAYGCTNNCFGSGGPTDVNASGEIRYWDVTNPYVTRTSTSVVTLPFNVPQNFFPPNGTGPCDGGTPPCAGFQAAELFGNLVVPTNTTETVSFTIGADDMAFAYLDGRVVCDLGGVHGSTPGTCVTPFSIGAGTHSLEVFFVDINQVQSGLSFNVNTGNVTTQPGGGPVGVPEPASLTLLSIGIAGAAFARRRLVG